MMAFGIKIGRLLLDASVAIYSRGHSLPRLSTATRAATSSASDIKTALQVLLSRLRRVRLKRSNMELLFAVITSIIFLATLLRFKYPWLRYEFKQIRILADLGIKVLGYEKKKKFMVDIFEDKVAKHPDKTFLVFKDKYYSYDFMNRKMNMVANVGQSLGLKQGDVVAVLMENEPAFIWTFYGLSKIGVQPAFLNFNLRQKSLLHCFTVSGARHLIVGQSEGDEMLRAVQDIQSELEKLNVSIFLQGHEDSAPLPSDFKSFDELMTKSSDTNISKSYRDKRGPTTPFCYIYTSGTTGLPKAAIVSHDKALKGALLMHTTGANEDDIIYTPLPLYHSAAGLVGLGTAVEKGATLVLRKKFSASQFWQDCQKHNVTVIQYIGELCRYLVAREPSPSDRAHKVRLAFGNGLRRDIWQEFQNRFNIPIIGEFYAATEGNAGFINFFNKFGSVGRNAPLLKFLYTIYFIKYDLVKDEPVRDDKGWCVKAKTGEPGLMISKIKPKFEFDGYKGNKELSQKKILCDVFTKGDRYFNTGDLMTCDEDCFVYFTDRIGDTFRWKGENVSTIEVSNVIADQDWIEDANVYGVSIPGQDGRAGMAAITVAKGHDLNEANLQRLYHHCDLLPVYARPRFLRFQKELEVTGTFKQRKVELVKEGFDPDKAGGEPLYVMDQANTKYIPLGKSEYQNVLDGKIRL